MLAPVGLSQPRVHPFGIRVYLCVCACACVTARALAQIDTQDTKDWLVVAQQHVWLRLVSLERQGEPRAG